ncbi:MAG: hypothetical protein IJ092_03215 [Atopobiaceae bacterium]|nr:hypothetical protein [Atopobiaceae bacterium]
MADSSVAFGVRNVDTVGTTDVALRKIFGALYPTKGIISGCAVSGRSNLAYNVAEGVVSCSKGASDGSTLAWVPAGTTPAVAANSSSYARLDAVWVEAHDATQGDADNLVTLGVTQGTAAASPAVPTIPTGATLLAVMSMPAGATKTSSASVSSKGVGAIPYGSSLGVLVDKTDTANQSVLPASEYDYAAGTFTLPTKRMVDIKQTFTLLCGSQESSAYARVLIDGTQVWQGEVHVFPSFATSQYFEASVELEAGTHSIQAKLKRGVRGDTVKRYWSKSGWAGQHLQVVDAGAVT